MPLMSFTLLYSPGGRGGETLSLVAARARS